MNKKTSRKRPQNPKPPKHSNPAMYRAMVEQYHGSAADPHRNRSRYDRNDYRRDAQNGRWE